MKHLVERARPWADSAFRVLFSLIFVTAGLNHILHPEAIVGRLLSAPLGVLTASIAPPGLLVVATGVALLAGGTALLLGARSRVAALLLAVCLVPITVTVQLAPGQMGPLFKNVALLGGLLHFMVAGTATHALGVDAWLARRGRFARSSPLAVAS